MNGDPGEPAAEEPDPRLTETQPIAGSPGPIVGKVVAPTPPDGDETPVRRGSPFRVDPLDLPEFYERPVELIVDGALRYTAMGAVTAAVVVAAFGAASAWWFPAGGTMIAALGCVLSIFGLYSNLKLTSVGMLSVHLAIFVVSYGRSIG